MLSTGHGVCQSMSSVDGLLHHTLFAMFLNRKNHLTSLVKRSLHNETQGQRTSRHDIRQSRFQKTRTSPVKEIGLHFQSTPIDTVSPPKTQRRKRANPPKLHYYSTRYEKQECIQNDGKAHIPVDLSHSQVYVGRRAKFIPGDRPIGANALAAVLINMFGNSAESMERKPSFDITNEIPDPSASRIPTKNTISNFTPPRNIPPQGSPAFLPSPELQIIQKLSKIRQLQKRSFSTSTSRRTENTTDDDIPRTPSAIATLDRVVDNWRNPRRVRMVLGRSRPDRQRKYIQRTSTPGLLSKARILRGLPLVSAPSISLKFDGKLREVTYAGSSQSNWDSSSDKANISEANTSVTLNDTPSSSASQDIHWKGDPSQQSLKGLSKTLWDHLRELEGGSKTPSILQSATHCPPSSHPSARVAGLLPNSPPESVLTDIVSPSEQAPISRLAHGLDRVLFNQSIHWLQDPHSKVFNFSPDLQMLPSVTDFAFERLPKYKYSSGDDHMLKLAVEHSKPFIGSTSTLTKVLSHIYFLLSENKLVDISTLSMAFVDQSRRFTPGMRAPAYFTLHRRQSQDESNGQRLVYAVDVSRPEVPEPQAEWNVLLWLGTMMEKFLTFPKEEFNNLRRDNPAPLFSQDRSETYRYAKSSKFIMRSQLDCQDSRLPGTGVFDLKSRAVLPIRIDQLNIQEHSGYMIRHKTGLLESFEREYYDLIRSAFLKYNFQARIGNMDGVFVAYHNTARLFGFQYIPVTEMEERLYGPGHSDRGPRIFQKCIGLMEALMEYISGYFPGYSLNCTMETREETNELVIWVVPVNYDGFPIPIEELVVTVQHTVNGLRVTGKVAIERAYQDWTVQYTISRSSKPQMRKWEALKECQRRAEFGVVLPAGVSADNARARLGSVNWGAGLGFNWNPEDRVSARSPDEALAAQTTTANHEFTGLKLTSKSRGLIAKLRRMAQKRRGIKTERITSSPVVEKPSVMWGRDPDVVDVSQSNPTTELEAGDAQAQKPRIDQTSQTNSTGSEVMSTSFYRL